MGHVDANNTSNVGVVYLYYPDTTFTCLFCCLTSLAAAPSGAQCQHL